MNPRSILETLSTINGRFWINLKAIFEDYNCSKIYISDASENRFVLENLQTDSKLAGPLENLDVNIKCMTAKGKVQDIFHYVTKDLNSFSISTLILVTILLIVMMTFLYKQRQCFIKLWKGKNDSVDIEAQDEAIEDEPQAIEMDNDRIRDMHVAHPGGLLSFPSAPVPEVGQSPPSGFPPEVSAFRFPPPPEVSAAGIESPPEID